MKTFVMPIDIYSGVSSCQKIKKFYKYLIVKKSLNLTFQQTWNKDWPKYDIWTGKKNIQRPHKSDKEKGKINNCQETEFFNFFFLAIVKLSNAYLIPEGIWKLCYPFQLVHEPF